MDFFSVNRLLCETNIVTNCRPFESLQNLEEISFNISKFCKYYIIQHEERKQVKISLTQKSMLQTDIHLK